MADCQHLPVKVKGKFCCKGKYKKASRMKQFNSAKKKNNNNILSEIEHSYANESTPYSKADDTTVNLDDFDVLENICVQSVDNIQWNECRRVVELKHLADQLVCVHCNNRLHLSNIECEKRYGLGSLLYIKCDSTICGLTNTVSTVKRNCKGAFDINSKVTLAMIHSGMGPTRVINFLSTCNIPPIDTTTLKKKEKEISASIVQQAKESCQRAREEEMDATSDQMECSFDAGWQTRGSGCQYNSSTGMNITACHRML